MNKYLVSVDPGRFTGLCVYNKSTRKIHELHTFNFWDTIAFIKNFRQYMGGLMNDTDQFMVILEDPGLNKPIFMPTDRGMTLGAKLRKAQDVGRNKENAFLLMEFFNKENIAYQAVKPTTTKWNAQFFKQISGFTGGSNQHERDAAKLTVGR